VCISSSFVCSTYCRAEKIDKVSWPCQMMMNRKKTALE
jgi:hypothetical protein